MGRLPDDDDVHQVLRNIQNEKESDGSLHDVSAEERETFASSLMTYALTTVAGRCRLTLSDPC